MDQLKIDFRFWITCNDEPLIGKGKLCLLKKIHETGSLLKAAEELKMSYRKVYYSVDKMNKTASQPLVIMKRGGKNGGSSELTQNAIDLIELYQRIETELKEFISRKSI